MTNFLGLLISIYLGGRYWLSDAGGLCQTPVPNQEECRKAVKIIRNAIDGVDEDHERDDRPHGCFLHTLNNVIHWNPHPGRSNIQDKQVCTSKCPRGDSFSCTCTFLL